MPDRIRPRRPIAWNQLLMKGHAHETARTAQRHQQRQQLESEIDEYYWDSQHLHEHDDEERAKDGPNPSELAAAC